MKKRAKTQKIIGWQRGNYCPDCGRKVHHIARPLPQHNGFWLVYHFFTNEVCFHIEKNCQLSLERVDRIESNGR